MQQSRGGVLHIKNADFLPNNVAMLNIAQIIKIVMTYSAKAEIEAIFINTCKTVPAQKALK